MYHQNGGATVVAQYILSMPYKPRMIEALPEWIYLRSSGDECLFDVLVEAWVASQKARRAIQDRGDAAPRTCSDELEAADGILEAIRAGRVPPRQLAKKAAQAVRKFDMAYQCARFLERDDSPRFAQVRVLASREDSVLARSVRRGTR